MLLVNLVSLLSLQSTLYTLYPAMVFMIDNDNGYDLDYDELY